MAILHPATLSPTKQELLDAFFGGPVAILGSYRFDDPDGEVGVEGFVLSVEAWLRHLVLTYRGAELEDGADHLVGTMEHSVLGNRWIYDGLGDPVALACFQRALAGEQQQAAQDIHHADGRVVRRDPTAQIELLRGDEGRGMVIAGDLPLEVTTATRLRATWDGGSAIVAALV